MYDNRKPSVHVIKDLVVRHDNLYPYSKLAYDGAINLAKVFPKNKRFEDVLIKVCFLNDAFKTRIGDTMQVAIDLHSVKNLDVRMQKGDYSLIHDICHYKSKTRNYHFYSFATKFCHIHYPDVFPIYDQLVVNSLEYYRNNFDGYDHFYTNHLKKYGVFVWTIEVFRKFSDATNLSYSKIDRFLWCNSNPSFKKLER